MRKTVFIISMLMMITCKKDNCIDESKINPNKGCTTDAPGVCGCNKKTYTNACEAEKAGVISYTNGPCKK